MKRFSIPIMAAMFLLLFSSNAAALQFGAGAKLGMSMGALSGKKFDQTETSVKKSMRPGFAGYGLLSIAILDNFGAELELGYTSRGETWSDKSNDNNYFSLDFDYLEIPLLIKGMLPLGPVKPMLYAGPSLGFPLSAKRKVHAQEAWATGEGDYSLPDSTRSSREFGLVFGGGATCEAGPGALVVDMRYRLGLTDVFKAPESEKKSPYYDDTDYESRFYAFSIMIGYIFKL
jgi:hypothetical protein